MEHSKNFEKAKKNYTTMYNGERLWNEDRLRKLVEKGWITSEDFAEITGKEY